MTCKTRNEHPLQSVYYGLQGPISARNLIHDCRRITSRTDAATVQDLEPPTGACHYLPGLACFPPTNSLLSLDENTRYTLSLGSTADPDWLDTMGRGTTVPRAGRSTFCRVCLCRMAADQRRLPAGFACCIGRLSATLLANAGSYSITFGPITVKGLRASVPWSCKATANLLLRKGFPSRRCSPCGQVIDNTDQHSSSSIGSQMINKIDYPH